MKHTGDIKNIHFNLSHSGNQLALAFSTDSPVGIDIEKLHPVKKKEQIAHRFFHPEEAALFHTPNTRESENLFFRYWTMKEAFVKGLGHGLSLPINSFLIEHEKNDCPDIYHIIKSQEDYTRWRIQAIPAPDCYVCSVAYQVDLP